MRYVVKCEKCGRPGSIEKQTFDEKRNEVRTTYKNTCECGGKVKALLE